MAVAISGRQVLIFALQLLSMAIVLAPVASFQPWSFKHRSTAPHQSRSCHRRASTIGSGDIVDTTIQPISAQTLRDIQVTDSNGRKVRLGNAMSDKGTSVVVFLRHLGCTWCWSYVYQWKLAQKELNEAGIEGPIFVSIGDEDRLNAFLLKNPEIPSDKFFVDGYDFSASREAGFGRFDEKPKELTEGVKPKPAKFGGFRGWWVFLTSFIPLAPVTPDMKFPENLTPEGLFWVGGTFVVKGNEIVYRWNDRISGDHPEASDVVEVAKKVSTLPLSEGSSVPPEFFGLFSGIKSGKK